MPASSTSSARRSAESGVSAAGFSTTVLPQASAGPSFQLAMLSGKFQGTIRPDDAERLAEGRVHPARDGDRLAVVLVDRAGVEVEDLGDHADLAARARDRLADVLRLDLGELLGVLLDERREPPQQARPVGRGDRPPGRKRGLGPRDGGVGLLEAGLLELGDRLLRRRVEHGESHGDDSTRSRPACARGPATCRPRQSAPASMLRDNRVASFDRSLDRVTTVRRGEPD